MKSSETTGKIAAALIVARSAITAVPKSGRNQYDKYDYSTHEDFVASCFKHLLAAGVIVTQSVIDTQYENVSDQTPKTPYRCRMTMATRAVHEISGEWIEVNSAGDGFDRNDKAPYKAMTGASKYGYRNLLGLPTSDDPEAYEEDSKPVKSKSAPKPVNKKEPEPAADSDSDGDGDGDGDGNEDASQDILANLSSEFIGKFEEKVAELDSAAKMRDTADVVFEMGGDSFEPDALLANLDHAIKMKSKLQELKKAMSGHEQYRNCTTIQAWNVVVRRAEGETKKITTAFIDKLTRLAEGARDNKAEAA